eukprot:2482828-Amphidinium_carterae.1
MAPMGSSGCSLAPLSRRHPAYSHLMRSWHCIGAETGHPGFRAWNSCTRSCQTRETMQKSDPGSTSLILGSGYGLSMWHMTFAASLLCDITHGTHEDMMHVLEQHPKKKAIGVDRWSLANWAILPDVLTYALHELICRTEDIAFTPPSWATKVVLIPKPGVTKKRPIAIIAAPWRLEMIIGHIRPKLMKVKVTKAKGCVLACSIYNAWAEASQARDRRLVAWEGPHRDVIAAVADQLLDFLQQVACCKLPVSLQKTFVMASTPDGMKELQRIGAHEGITLQWQARFVGGQVVSGRRRRVTVQNKRFSVMLLCTDGGALHPTSPLLRVAAWALAAYDQDGGLLRTNHGLLSSDASPTQTVYAAELQAVGEALVRAVATRRGSHLNPAPPARVDVDQQLPMPIRRFPYPPVANASHTLSLVADTQPQDAVIFCRTCGTYATRKWTRRFASPCPLAPYSEQQLKMLMAGRLPQHSKANGRLIDTIDISPEAAL